MNNIKYSLLVLLALLAACGQNTAQQPSNIVGLLEVKFSLDGQAQANFIPQGVSAQANTVVSDVGINFVRQFVNFNDDDVNSVRYVSAVFGITNTSSTPFNNLTLYAINVPTNIGGTGVAAMNTADGLAVPSAITVAQGMKPTHGMGSTLKGLEVDPDGADLHVIDQTEANTIQQGALGLTPPVSGFVLQYGFVARNLSGGRSIGNSSCVGTNCNKGAVTLAYKLPKVNPRKDNPFTFSLYFVVANETNTIVTQSLEEQASNQGLKTRVSNLGAGTQVRILIGSTYTGAATHFCGVRTAGTNLAPLADLFSLSQAEVDIGCGNNSSMLAAINNARANGGSCFGTPYPPAPAVVWNPLLARAAIDHARDQGLYDYPGFANPITGVTLTNRIAQAGFVGNNYNFGFRTNTATAQNAVSAWLSEGFCFILDSSYTQLGMAAELTIQPDPVLKYWVFILAR